MPDTIWSLSKLNQQRFAAAALAVACTQEQQDAGERSVNSGDDSDDGAMSDSDSIHTRDLVKSHGKEKLQQRFLNRLAEIFARQKTPHGSTSNKLGASRDADHATATLLGSKANRPLVYVAKNAGLDDEDRQMLSTLQKWLRALSLSGERRSPEHDILWPELVEFNTPRLAYYISELSNLKDYGKSKAAVSLRERCETYLACASPTTAELMGIVTEAYSLRQSVRTSPVPKHVKLTNLLGRLRAAWETLQEYAMHFADCKDIELLPVNLSKFTDIPSKYIKRELQKLKKGLGNEKAICKKLKKTEGLRLHTHAEMQLILLHSLVDTQSKCIEFLPYMGSSKKTCFLCERMLQAHGYFSSRGSHGKASGHWTVLTDERLGTRSLLKLTGCLYDLQEYLVNQASAPFRRQRLAVAESTAGVTTSESAATILKNRHRQQKRKQQLSVQDDATGCQEERPKIFGKFLDSIRAVRLPADTVERDIVSLGVFEKGLEPEGLGFGSNVLDFRPFWGDILHREQGYQMLSLKDEGSQAQEEDYLVYYSLNEDLLLNKCIANTLDIADEASVPECKPFWRGDVFVVRFQDISPTETMFLDMPTNPRLDSSIDNYIRNAWKTDGLSRLRKSALWMEEGNEKDNRDRELLRARLKPFDAEMLRHSPMGFEATLDYLAAMTADHGAFIDSSFETCADDPSKIRVNVRRRVDKLVDIGWHGFNASNMDDFK